MYDDGPTWQLGLLSQDHRTQKTSKRTESCENLLPYSPCALAIPAFCQSPSKWQVATIIDVKPHAIAGENPSDPAAYDVSVKVGDTVYTVLYTARSDEPAAKYRAGRELLVLVEENTITYNDMLGRSFQVPIEARRSAAEVKHSR